MGNQTNKQNKGMNNGDKKQRFLPNNRYFTICIYAMIVIAFGAVVVRVIMTPYAVSQGLFKILNVLMPFIMGVLIALILNPIINRIRMIMEKQLKLKKYQRLCFAVPIALAYLIVLGFIITCLFFVIPQLLISVTDLVNSLPQLYKLNDEFFQYVQQHFPNTDVSGIEDIVNSILPNIINYLKNLASSAVPAVYAVSVSVVKWILNSLIAIIISGYILTDKKNLKKLVRTMLYYFLPSEYFDLSIEILEECNHIFTNFIVSKALDSLIIGCLCFISMTIFGMEYALLISAIVGITNMIPYFGPFIGAVPGAVVLLIVSPWKSLAFLILILVLQQFDGLYLGPKIMGESMGIKPLWIIVSITLGGKMAGVFGMFLSVPIAAIIVYLAERMLKYQSSRRDSEEMQKIMNE